MNKNTKIELLKSFGVVFLASFISIFCLNYLSFLSNLENISNDIRMAVFQAPAEQSKDIVIASINEETLERFPYRSPVDRAYLADLLKTIDKKGAKAIGVDILFDQPTELTKDNYLKKTLMEIKTPLFISYTNTPSIVDENQLKYLSDFFPESLRAAANLSTDPFDGSVRWIFPGESSPGMPIGFARKAAQILGVNTSAQAIEIAWSPKTQEQSPAFKIYPSQSIGSLPDAWIKDKIVLVGAVLSITDRHRTPLAIVNEYDEGFMPGIIIQAHSLSQLIEGRKYPRLSMLQSSLISLLFAAFGMIIGLQKRGVIFNVLSGISLIIAWWVFAFFGFSYAIPMFPLVGPTLSLSLSLWMMDTLIGGAERKQRQFVQKAFSRYVSPEVVNQLVEDPSALQISGIRREATFIFTDIAGFTTLSEKLTSEKLSEVLNEYLEGACNIVLSYEGTVDKFIGDAIMCIFNAPIEQKDHAQRAVKCALALDEYAEAFRVRQNALGVPIGVTRIGVHTGMATIGNFGSSARMDFTALGDTVNTAARTEGVNKYFGTRICCTQETVFKTPEQLYRPIGNVVLKGKIDAVGLFSPISQEQYKSDLYLDYMNFYDQLVAHQEEARQKIVSLHALYPDDPLINFHLERVNSGLLSELIVMDDK